MTGHWLGGHEGYSYLWRTAEVGEQLATGTLWPRWCPDFYWGFGYPFFVFYPPGVFVGASLLGGGPLGLGGMALLGCVALFYGMRRLARLFVQEPAARAAAALATLATYRFVQVWVRGDYAESVATGVLPWVLAEALLLARGDPAAPTKGLASRDLAAGARLAMGIALLSFLHALTAVMGCAAVAVIGLWSGRRVLRVGVPALLGLVLSAAYWLPVAVHASLVRFGQMVDGVPGGPSYFWGDHFPTLLQRLGVETLDDMSLASHPLAWVLVPAAGVLVFRAPSQRSRLLPALAAWAAVQALMLPISSPLWRWLPGLGMFQFPWRFLLLDAVLVAMLGALVLDALRERGGPSALVPTTLAATLLLALPTAIPLLQRAATDPFPLGPAARAALDDPTKLQTLGASSPDSRHIPLTTAGRNEYLPRTVHEPPRQHPASPGAIRHARDLGPPRAQKGAWKRWQVQVPEAGRYELSWFWFPGLAATVDGVPTPLGREETRGVLTVELAAGPRTLDVFWEGTWATRLGASLSALGWALALAMGLALNIGSGRRSTGSSARPAAGSSPRTPGTDPRPGDRPPTTRS